MDMPRDRSPAMWKSIEDFSDPSPIWVIKYTHTDENGMYTDCHGWYSTEAEALAVLRHFPKPNTYTIEKVYHRKLLPTN
jgi:hypothetical protein